MLFAPIEFTRDAQEDAKVLKGIAVKLCDNGVKVYSDCPLTEGDRISVKGSIPTPHRNFIVQWSEELLSGFFVLGLIFSSSDSKREKVS